MTTKEFERIYNQYWWHVFSFAKSKLDTLVDWFYPQEVTAEVFIQLWRSQPEFKEEKNIKAWLFMTANSRIIDVIRKESRYEIGPLSVEEYRLYENDWDRCEIENEVLKSILDIVKTFHQREQQIFDLHYLKELPAGKIAQILKTSQQTVSNQLSTLKKKLKTEVKNRGLRPG